MENKNTSRRTLRRRYKKILLAEADSDIKIIEARIEKLPRSAVLERAGLERLLDILRAHSTWLINREV